MSALHTLETEMKDAGALQEAIVMTSEGKLQAEVFETPQLMEGSDSRYWSATADVIIRKSLHKGWHDIGFQRQADGNFKVLMSDMDQRQFSDGWLNTLRQNYMAITVVNDLRSRGYSIFERESVKTEDGVRVFIRAQTPPHLAPRTAHVATTVQRPV